MFCILKSYKGYIYTTFNSSYYYYMDIDEIKYIGMEFEEMR